MAPRKEKESDPGWKYGIAITKDKKKVRCTFCGKELHGGINRLKKHIAGIVGDVIACNRVSKEVKEEIRNYIEKKDAKKNDKKAMEDEIGSFGMDNREFTEEEVISEFKRRRGMKQSEGCESRPASTFGSLNTFVLRSKLQSVDLTNQMKLKTSWDKHAGERVCEALARFFYHGGIPLHQVESSYFRKLLKEVGSYGPTFSPPSTYELSNRYLTNEVKYITEYLKEIEVSWVTTGCTIMPDGWTDQKGRTLINFLVSSPRGTVFLKSVDASGEVKDANLLFKLLNEVVEEVGEENVIQVITDNASNYKAAGAKLMEKKKHLFWTPCSAHCIDLMLESIGKMKIPASCVDDARKITKFIYNHAWVLSLMRAHTQGRELLRPGITRFATHFITLQSLYEQRENLRKMFLSEMWSSSRYAKAQLGRKVEEIIYNPTFWRKVDEVCKSIEPLVKVLRIVDGDQKPSMGLVYDGMLKAKIEIAEALNSNIRKFKSIWEKIDERWADQLHHPLHGAGYFLNPSIQYTLGKSEHPEIKRGLMKCITVLEPNYEKQYLALNELTQFINAENDFGTSLAKGSRNVMQPAVWWDMHGIKAPNLSRIAIRILSQTTSSSGCERNWSTFDQIYTKKRNRLKQSRLDQLVYIHYNLRLRERQLKRIETYDPISLDNVLLENALDDWVVEVESPVFEEDDLSFLDAEIVVDRDEPIEVQVDEGDVALEAAKQVESDDEQEAQEKTDDEDDWD